MAISRKRITLQSLISDSNANLFYRSIVNQAMILNGNFIALLNNQYCKLRAAKYSNFRKILKAIIRQATPKNFEHRTDQDFGTSLAE